MLKPISNGKYPNVYHWQNKAAVSDYIWTQKPDLWKKTTEVLFPNYFENCVTQPRTYLPVKQPDGTYLRSFVIPEATPLPDVAISDARSWFTYEIDIQYKEPSSEEFQSIFSSKMDDMCALDLREQLLIFRDSGMSYVRPIFLQANELPGLDLMKWEDFMAAHDLAEYMTSSN
ncbi:hypothetical protein FGADI_8953 [Fusarium gaditjirri]|uniref:Uncharacterized protein n=1 Tax=Fusarium gaditjirri TaxID=282569 RepID=A0A8H4WTH2_9HYPO|nr:hypothetical protein FGADI_8953 [Fusarium gaditjirri]